MHRTRIGPALGGTLLVALTGIVLIGTLGVPTPSVAACGSDSLFIRAKVKESIAAGNQDEMDIEVKNRGGRIRRARAELYTFDGELLGSSKRVSRIGSKSSKRISIRLEEPLQEGSYTLVVKGKQESGCGTLEYNRVIKQRSCTERLRISFPSPPGGLAADYEDFLSVEVDSRGSTLKSVRGRVFSISGELIGSGSLGTVSGRTTLDMELSTRLVPGGYKVIVDGRNNQPAACGRKSKELSLQFA